MVYWFPYPWKFDPLIHGIYTPYSWYFYPVLMVFLPPYPWHIITPFHGIFPPWPRVFCPLSMVYWLPYPWYIAFWPPYPWYTNFPTYGISKPLLWYYEPLSFGRNEGGQFTMRGFKIQWRKNDLAVNISLSKLTLGTIYHGGQNTIWHRDCVSGFYWSSEYDVSLLVHNFS